MTAIPARQRRRLLAAFFSGLVAACALPLGVVAGANLLLNSSGGRSVDANTQLKIPSTPTALLATVNDTNEVTTLTVFVLAPQGVGGTIISLPANTRAEVVGIEAPRRLADSYAQGGISAIALDTEGVLDVTFASVGALGVADVTALLSVVPSIRVEFDQPVVNTAMTMPDPTTTTTLKSKTTATSPPMAVPVDNELFPAGETTLAPDQFAAVLTATRAGEIESDRFARTKSLWSGAAAAVGGGVALDPAQFTDTTIPGIVPAEIASFVRRVFAGPVQVWQLSAESLSGVDNPLGIDLYGLDRSEVLLLMASVAPSSLSGVNGGFAVQIDSPFNDVNISHAVVERLTYLGIGVALVREVRGPPAQQTIFRYTDSALLDGSQARLESVLGMLKYSKVKQPVEGVNAQIVLGQDFADFIAASPTLPATTIPASEE
ncbi:MAG: hypothetical protein AAB018_03120 [Actinomycetota bacterium]